MFGQCLSAQFLKDQAGPLGSSAWLHTGLMNAGLALLSQSGVAALLMALGFCSRKTSLSDNMTNPFQ